MSRKQLCWALVLAGGLGVGVVQARGGAGSPGPQSAMPATVSDRLAPFVPTPHDVVNKMLELAHVSSGDVVYDLGSGDGRIVIAAAKAFGARGVGIDIDPARVAEATRNAQAAGVSNLVEFRVGDAMQADVSGATVVTLYLLSSANRRLQPMLQRQLKPGARVVSHNFGMGADWPPEKVEQFTDSMGSTRTLYLWTIK
jgi:SAM-dependent methyltransferase